MKYLIVVVLFSINLFCADSISMITKTFSCSKQEAKALFSKIRIFTESLQGDIEYCINSSDSKDKKNARIEKIIEKHYVSKSSIVQVSSLNRDAIFNYLIKIYLRRLTRLKEIYNYTSVKLYFQPDYLGLGKFRKISENKYELAITMKQIFTAYFGEKVAYEDITSKKFRLFFYIDSIGKVSIKVDEILVGETLNRRKGSRYGG